MAMDPGDLLRCIVDAYDALSAAEADLEPREVEPFRSVLARCVDEADALTGRRRQRGRVAFRRTPAPGGG